MADTFQLPLSGSLGYSVAFTFDSRTLTFNSLSRDHVVWPGSVSHIIIDLSTPILGITEPDSGIFRLSAAFCRGTLSHK
jgi:hypothetical protein